MPPTLPPELILRILILAADQARVGASADAPVDPFLRHLALICTDWRQFGQAQLLREVHLRFDSLDEPGPVYFSRRGYRLICALWTTSGLGSAVARLVVEGSGMFGAYRWGDLLGLCGKLTSLSCSSIFVNLGLLSSCQGLEELVLDKADFRWPQSASMPMLKRLKVSDCDMVGARLSVFGPDSFPSLEVLTVIDSGKFACPALTATPSLRALVISTSLQLDSPTPPPSTPQHILYDLSASSLAPESQWRRGDRRPTHLRCSAAAHLAAVADLIEQGHSALHALRTLYIHKLDGGGRGEVSAGLSRLAYVARERGIAVVCEDEQGSGGFGFDHFIKHCSRK